MAKGLTIMAISIAILLLALFGLDLAVGIPFKRVSPRMDIIFILCAMGLGYISWTTFRDLR